MKYQLLALTFLFALSISAQKKIQKAYFVTDMGLNYTGGMNYATSKDLIPKVGYTVNVGHENEFNNGRIFRVGIGHSLNGFAFDTRFTNVLHQYYLNTSILYGKKYDNGDRFYIGVTPGWAFKTNVSDSIGNQRPSDFDVRLHMAYTWDINRIIGFNFTTQIGGLNINMYRGGFMHHWAFATKLYIRIRTKFSEAFIPQ